MEELSYTSTHPLGLTGSLPGSLYLYLYIYNLRRILEKQEWQAMTR